MPRKPSAVVINITAGVYIGTPAMIAAQLQAFAGIKSAIINMDSPTFIPLEKEPNQQQLDRAIAITALRKVK